MEGNVMNGKALWNDRKLSGRDQKVKRAFMIAGAILGAVLLIGAMASPLHAQPYPTKPIRFVLPFPPAGPTDFLGRIIGDKLRERLGQPVVPENRPGAGGNVGLEATAKARPDGYTITIGSLILATAPSLYKKLGYDPIKDLAPISLVSEYPNLLVVNPALPVNSLKDLIEYARANPGKLNYASSGVGTGLQLAMELLKTLTKIDIVHVPYKGGGGPAMTSVMSGETQMMVIGPQASMAQIQAGRVKALAIFTDARVPSLPNVPTAREVGIDLVFTSWHGVLTTGGTPRDIVNKLNQEWVKISGMPDVQEKMRTMGFEARSSTPEEFSEFIKAETARLAKVIKEANVPTVD
jgi:tripartite-type tricarboxylate transporter receptor subunit TctC